MGRGMSTRWTRAVCGPCGITWIVSGIRRSKRSKPARRQRRKRMSEEKIEPVRKEVLVNASQERAFQVFTQGIDKWWPRQHHIGKSPLKKAILEGMPNGRWYATHEDGSETGTGKVLVWEPPQRLILAWQLNAKWQFDPEFVTEIEVTF